MAGIDRDVVSLRSEERRLRDEYEEDVRTKAREELYGPLHFDAESKGPPVPPLSRME